MVGESCSTCHSVDNNNIIVLVRHFPNAANDVNSLFNQLQYFNNIENLFSNFLELIKHTDIEVDSDLLKGDNKEMKICVMDYDFRSIDH